MKKDTRNGLIVGGLIGAGLLAAFTIGGSSSRSQQGPQAPTGTKTTGSPSWITKNIFEPFEAEMAKRGMTVIYQDSNTMKMRDASGRYEFEYYVSGDTPEQIGGYIKVFDTAVGAVILDISIDREGLSKAMSAAQSMSSVKSFGALIDPNIKS